MSDQYLIRYGEPIMNVITLGHEYTMQSLDGFRKVELTFVNRGHGVDAPGTTNQEVLRVLIDRVEFLDKELPWQGNAEILRHLRTALVLHEARHLERLVDRGLLHPENVATGADGHFILNT